MSTGKEIWIEKKIKTKAELLKRTEKMTDAERCIRLLTDPELCLVKPFLDEHGTPFAWIKVNDHTETWPIRSRVFKNYVVKICFDAFKMVLSDTSLNQVIRYFEAVAISSDIEKELHVRAYFHRGMFLIIDLCDERWEALKITPEEIWPEESHRFFRRYAHMKKLNVDLNAELKDIDLIFNFIPVAENDRRLFKVTLIADMLPHIPRPITVFYGPQGSGKSTSQKMMRMLIDPSSTPTLTFPNDKKELAQILAHHYYLVFDNVRKLSKEQSDMICKAVTGDGFSKRELYTDEEDIIFKFKRKISINGINLASEEPDFLDRSIIFHLTRIPKDKRKTEEELWKEFEKVQPRITGAIIKIIQKAMAIKDDVAKEIKELPRMADFAIWGEAISRAMGEPSGAFLHDYWQKIGDVNTEALEANPVGLAIKIFMQDKEEWQGTATELLRELENIVETNKIVSTNSPSWPRASNSLTRRLNEIKPILEDEGISIETGVKIGDKRMVIIRRVGKNIVQTVLSSESIYGDEVSSDDISSNIVQTENTVQNTDGSDDNGRYLVNKKSIDQNDMDDKNDIFSQEFLEEIVNFCIDYQQEGNDTTPISEIMRALKSKYEEQQIESVIEKLKSSGRFELSNGKIVIIYEPKENELRVEI